MKLELKNPPEFVVMSRGDKVYLTANVFFAIPGNAASGKQALVMAIQRKKKIVDAAKLWLFGAIGEQQSFGRWFRLDEFPISMKIIYKTDKGENWDIDNKGYFWTKVLLDLLREKTIIPNDTVKYICSITQEYQKSESGTSLILNFESYYGTNNKREPDLFSISSN